MAQEGPDSGGSPPARVLSHPAAHLPDPQLGIFSGILNRYLLRPNGISHWPNICVMSISLALVLGIIMQQMPAHHLKKLDFPALRNCK